MTSPAKRREAFERLVKEFDVIERCACRVIRQVRSTQWYILQTRNDQERLTKEIVMLASKIVRYGYWRVTELLNNSGWRVNHRHVERIRRQEGLKVPNKQPNRRRLWPNDGSCMR